MAVRTSSMERHAVAHLQADETAVPGSNLTVTISGGRFHNCYTVKSQQPLSRGGSAKIRKTLTLFYYYLQNLKMAKKDTS